MGKTVIQEKLDALIPYTPARSNQATAFVSNREWKGYRQKVFGSWLHTYARRSGRKYRHLKVKQGYIIIRIA